MPQRDICTFMFILASSTSPKGGNKPTVHEKHEHRSMSTREVYCTRTLALQVENILTTPVCMSLEQGQSRN